MRRHFLIFLLHVSGFFSVSLKITMLWWSFPLQFLLLLFLIFQESVDSPQGNAKVYPLFPSVQWAKANSSSPLCPRPSLSMASVSDNCITVLPVKYILLLYLASKLNQFKTPLFFHKMSCICFIFSIFIAIWLKLFPSFFLHCFTLSAPSSPPPINSNSSYTLWHFENAIPLPKNLQHNT